MILAAFLNWLYDLEEISRVPKLPSISVPTHAPRIIAPATQDAILTEIPEDRRGPFLALVAHALRPGEVRALNVGDYAWRDRQLTLSHAMKGLTSAAERRGTKTRDVMRFPVADELAAFPTWKQPERVLELALLCGAGVTVYFAALWVLGIRVAHLRAPIVR